MRSLSKLFSKLLLLSLLSLAPQSGDAHCCGDLLVRLRGVWILPIDDSSEVTTISGASVDVDDAVTAELDFSYFLSDSFAVETILGAAKHDIDGEGVLAGTKIGSSWLIPSTTTLQYHPFPECCIQPYIGAGINYSIFFSEDCDIADTKLQLSNSFGLALQAGFDWMVCDCWFVNFDVKFAWVETKGTLTGGTPGIVYVDVDPIVIGIGIGRVF